MGCFSVTTVSEGTVVILMLMEFCEENIRIHRRCLASISFTQESKRCDAGFVFDCWWCGDGLPHRPGGAWSAFSPSAALICWRCVAGPEMNLYLYVILCSTVLWHKPVIGSFVSLMHGIQPSFFSECQGRFSRTCWRTMNPWESEFLELCNQG